jgi:hypothetical protein
MVSRQSFGLAGFMCLKRFPTVDRLVVIGIRSGGPQQIVAQFQINWQPDTPIGNWPT